MDKYAQRSLRVAGIYAIFGILWIIFSDHILAGVAGDAAQLSFVQTIKGLAYIFFTAALVYFLVRRVLVRQDALAEQAARSERRFQETFARAAVGIGHVSREGTWVYVNDKLCELIGRPREVILRQEVVALGDAPAAEEIRAKLDALLRRESDALHVEVRVPLERGERWVLVTIVSSAPLQGEEAVAVAFVEDISRRKLAEAERARLTEQLLHAQKMEAVGRLAGGVAHDFNNMLGVITGYTETVLDRCADNDAIANDLRQVLLAAERSAALTRQLLSFARKGVVNPKPVDLNAHLMESEPLLRQLAGKEISVHIEPGKGLWPVLIDSGQLDQVLANLTLNARDAIQGAGAITIRTDNLTQCDGECCSLQGGDSGDFVRLRFRDSGSGMEPEILEHVFEPFFTTKAVGKGTGLGLASVFGIVQQNRGDISVTSDPGAGTEFTICLPRYSGRVGERDRSTGPVGGSRRTVMVVEDEPQILRLLQRVLERGGFEVQAFVDPEAAFEAFCVRPEADLLVTDVLMPKMNGAEFARKLLALRPELRIIFMSGHTASVVLNCGIPESHYRYLQKPFPPAVLLNEVSGWLDGATTPGAGGV